MAGPTMAHPLPDPPAFTLPPHPSSHQPPTTQPLPPSAQPSAISLPPHPHSQSHSHSSSLHNTPSPAHAATHPRSSPHSTSPGDSNAGSSNLPSALSGDPSPSAARPSAAGSGPTNDDIEAVIQMAMASSNSPRTTNPPRDTRTQLFVGNLPYRVRWQDLKDLFRRAGTVLRADVSLGPDNRSRGYGTVLLATAEDAGRAVDMFNGYTWQTRTLEVRPDRMGEELGMAAAAAAVPFAGVGVGMGVGGLAANLGVGVFGTPLLGSLSPAAASLSGAGTPAAAVAGGSGLSSPAPSLARFAGLSPFGAGSTLGDDDGPGSRPGTNGGQSSRNLFVGNLPFHIQWQDLKDLFRQAGAVQRADVALGADGRSRGFGTVSFSNETDAERAVRMFNGYEYNGRPLKVHFDKFAAPSSSSAPLVGPGASSTPHSPATFAFSPSPFGSPYGQHQQPQQQQPSLARTSSLAQQLLQQQLEHGRGGSPASPLAARRPSGPYGYPSGGYDDSADMESLSQQLAQKLALASGSAVPQSPTSALAQQQQQQAAQQQQQQQQYARQQSQAPTHIPIPSALQSPYTFDFLHSGPTTPYDVYDLGTYQRMSMSMGDQAYYQQQYQQAQQQQQQQQDQYNAAFAASMEAASSQQKRDSAQSQSAMASESASSSTSPPSLAASGTPTQPGQSTSPTSSRSHATPQQHPAHPGPIALPPPPPVTAFPVPPPHTLSPQYASPHMQGHPMSPMHHPLMGMSMPMMTPHGLPPITPSMPSFTFLPQPSPGLPSPAAVESNEQRQAQHAHAQAQAMMHMQHVMTPFSPFSPGVTMSPGAFWGRPGSGANPFINAAVGAPVRPGQTYYTAYPQQMQQQPQQQQQQEPDQQSQSQAGEQEGRPPDGYFPPVAVSVAMAQGSAVAREEPAGYFPWVPPSNAAEAHQQQQQQQRELRTSGLAYEILRDDSASANAAAAAHRETKDSPSASDTTAGTGTTAGAESSRGTSWHTDSEGAVDDAESPLANGNGSGNGHDGHHGTGKPRAYSAETGAGAGSERGLLRADSDPVRKALAEQGAL